jgi:TMEM175 potassium channel family protein
MNSASTNSDDDRGSDPSRVLALSDGVFAIILTLLVLEIHVPDLGQGQTLDHALRESRPSFEAFIISFVVVAIAWAGHRDLFALVRRTDRTLVWLNMLYLFPLSLVPFGASLLARYNREPVALEMYGVLLVAITITRLAAWIYATGRPHLLITPIDVQSRRTGAAIVAVPGIAYAVASVLADSIPTATIAIFYAVPILYFITIALLRASAPAQSAEREFT